MLHKCNCEEWTKITNSYFAKGIGANANNRTDMTIKSCIDTLCMFQLVDKEKYPDSPFMYRFTPTRLSSAKEIFEAQLAQQKLQEEQMKQVVTEPIEDKNLQ